MENKETIVYLQINTWSKRFGTKRLIECYLDGPITTWKVDFPEGVVCKTVDDVNKWVEENKLCINSDVYDQSEQLWITTTKEWLTENFPELLDIAKEEPYDKFFINDKKYFLKYIPENYGYNFACSYDPDEVALYLKDNRFVLPELFEKENGIKTK